MKTRYFAIAAALALPLALALSACETATPYQPLTTTHAASGGFSNQQLAPDRYRVAFAGNTLTSRETVETYLLYRAAELTLEQGGDWFLMADRETQRDRQTFSGGDPFYDRPGYAFGYWRPSWRYLDGPERGWRTWDPFWGGRFGNDRFDVQTVERFEITAEIVIHRGAKAPDEPRAFDARDVVARLSPRIVRPAALRP